jgi:hypothetical protein
MATNKFGCLGYAALWASVLGEAPVQVLASGFFAPFNKPRDVLFGRNQRRIRNGCHLRGVPSLLL